MTDRNDLVGNVYRLGEFELVVIRKGASGFTCLPFMPIKAPAYWAEVQVSRGSVAAWHAQHLSLSTINKLECVDVLSDTDLENARYLREIIARGDGEEWVPKALPVGTRTPAREIAMYTGSYIAQLDKALKAFGVDVDADVSSKRCKNKESLHQIVDGVCSFYKPDYIIAITFTTEPRSLVIAVKDDFFFETFKPSECGGQRNGNVYLAYRETGLFVSCITTKEKFDAWAKTNP